MRTARPDAVLWGIGCWLGLAAASCGRDRVEIIGALPDGGSVTTPCPSTPAARLTVTSIAVDKNIAWLKPGYDYFPADERVALAIQPDGQAQIAWAEVNLTKASDGSQQPPLGVHITLLDSKLTLWKA
ncbi:MAG: hypothetical protein ABSF35_23770 [Polyangia bacterium]|jgi:hypothetical protein